VKLLCGSATEIGYPWSPGSGEAPGWLWKFCSGAGPRPERAADAVRRVIEIIKVTLESMSEPAESGDLGEAAYRRFYSAKNGVDHEILKGFGAVMFFYWLSLAEPEKFIPFDSEYCIFFDNQNECKRTLETTGHDAGLYYREFLHAVHSHIRRLDIIDREHRRFSDGRVRNLLELHAVLRTQILQDKLK
jgi:hypothetical protein